ncbi:ArsR/SmtB family transcription factor [Phormidium tenue]|uniref:ArsR family transcriptional regulator n=1 Tax=Phormidium tenue NIES-30 TaxID=549789 RepID=A0A1U7J4X7_9CYAN|nr:metalloregulator ArsR/SmtB family transcription factor [Phormidium tenue]MBD2232545.1 winged helix-turn-helix transcriptional regulator [Phormidium tenue FACHB-1052]OKH47684.1 ArsR family transcriptional regulator [Phormidium tenue NIES-30]
MSTALQTASSATTIAKFKALSDPLRLEVIELLRSQEMCVCDLCDRMAIAQSKLSFHLKTLREAGLISARQDGRWIYYSLNPAEFGELEDYLRTLRHLSPQRPACPCPPDRL